MALSETLTKDLTASMKAKDAARTSVLRMAKAALKNREIEKGEPLDEAEVVKTLQGLVKQRVAHFNTGGFAHAGYLAEVIVCQGEFQIQMQHSVYRVSGICSEVDLP